MNTAQLQCCIECNPVLTGHILGVFPADHLPEEVPYYPCGFIANTDVSSKPGQHWIAFFLPQNRIVECFDSYGQYPGKYNSHFQRWVAKHTHRLTWNQRRIQSDVSNVCGLYCLHYLYQRLTGHTMTDIVRFFSTSHLEANDQFIYDFFLHAYSSCVQNTSVYTQMCKAHCLVD